MHQLSRDLQGRSSKERPPPLKLRRNFSCGQEPERAPIPRFIWLLCDFQGPQRGETRLRLPGTQVQRAAGCAPVSQNSTACEPPRQRRAAYQIRSTYLVADQSSVHRRGELESSRGGRTRATMARGWPVPSCLRGLPRKEVIQPQLPLRLPCYDFTPVASPTFDGSFPYGLGHRLRVLLTPMV